MATPMNEREAIENLQRYLRRLSYEENDLLPVPVDGIFDDRTREALSEFQRMMGLPVTGIADKVTWDTLFSEYDRLRFEEDRRVFPELFPSYPPNYETQLGEGGTFIYVLQLLLNELKIIYDTLPLLALTGILDEETSRSIKEFQRIHGIEQSGQVNRNTWNRITEEYNQTGSGIF